MNDQSNPGCLKQIEPDCISYRQCVDQLFEPLPEAELCWRLRYLDILVATTRLYLDYVLVMQHMPEFEAVAVKRRKTILFSKGGDREQTLRRKLTQELEDGARWAAFMPINPFSDDTGLIDLQAYKNRLTLHLPEIYEETFHVEVFAQSFLSNQNSTALAYLSVGLEHLGKNHISFVLQALQWLAYEGSWS